MNKNRHAARHNKTIAPLSSRCQRWTRSCILTDKRMGDYPDNMTPRGRDSHARLLEQGHLSGDRNIISVPLAESRFGAEKIGEPGENDRVLVRELNPDAVPLLHHLKIFEAHPGGGHLATGAQIKAAGVKGPGNAHIFVLTVNNVFVEEAPIRAGRGPKILPGDRRLVEGRRDRGSNAPKGGPAALGEVS